MKFDDLDKKMRVDETATDLCVLPGMFMVARLDGRSFTQLTKEGSQFEVPFDKRFRDLMVTCIIWPWHHGIVVRELAGRWSMRACRN